jgi:hypothetical protein
VANIQRLTGDQKAPFEKWLEIHRWDVTAPKNLGTIWYEWYVRHPLVVESAISILRVGYAPAVWGSASEREERLQRLKFRKKYLKKTPGIASSRPLRLVVRLSSSAASKRGLSGPATERIPLYPFVKPHESKRYG